MTRGRMVRRTTMPMALRAGLGAAVLAASTALTLGCSEAEHQFGSEELAPLPPTRGSDAGQTLEPRPPAPVPGEPFSPEDWRIFEATVRWGVENGLDSAPLGEAVVAVGRRLVGTPYVAGTLEEPGPERVVVNLRELDCVTYVENVLALTAFIRTRGAESLEERARAEAEYRGLLAALRYRGGVPSGYESRLHYFSEWLTDNARRGHLGLLAEELGAQVDPEPIDFMSTHPDAYRQLGDIAVRTAIRRVEGALNAAGGRRYLPESELDRLDEALRPGDVIAATSTVPGLDVAHTGIAVEVAGRIHLMHAPLVGDSVQVSPHPLAERIRRIASQDGIMAARPLPGAFFGPGSAPESER